MRVVGEAENSTAIVELLQEKEVDVLLSDFEIPGEMYRDGNALMALLRRTYPSTKVIFVTTLTNPLLLRAVIKSRAHGVLLKNDSPEEVISAVRAASRGQFYIAPSVRRSTADSNCSPTWLGLSCSEKIIVNGCGIIWDGFLIILSMTCVIQSISAH